jgi:hypothetical protein
VLSGILPARNEMSAENIKKITALAVNVFDLRNFNNLISIPPITYSLLPVWTSSVLKPSDPFLQAIITNEDKHFAY